MWINQVTSFKPRLSLKLPFASRADQTCVSPFHAVEIRCGKNACQAAQGKLGERHLSAEAALLPLDQCDRPDQCECRFQHYDDRRGKSRRRSDRGSSAQTDSERIERRSAKDRRAEIIAEDAKPFSVHEGSYYEHVGDTVRTAMLDASELAGVDPYNSGSFDKSKLRDSSSDK